MDSAMKTIDMDAGTGSASNSVTILPETRDVTPLSLLSQALSRGADMATLEKFMDLQERHERNQARKAFDAAIASAKAEIPVIRKNRTVDFTGKTGIRTNYVFEDLAEIARSVDPILSKHGLSYRFRTSSPPSEPVTVTCILSHRGGHSEENTLTAGRDDSGNKNSIQAIGSTITFLQRYTLKAALGLAAAADDDGKSSESPPEALAEETVKELQMKIVRSGTDLKKFLGRFVVERLEDLTPAQAQRASVLLDAKLAAEAKPEADAAP